MKQLKQRKITQKNHNAWLWPVVLDTITRAWVKSKEEMLMKPQIMLFLASFTLSAESCKQMSPEVLQALEEVVDEIYNLNTQDIQELVCQDFDCIPEISTEELQQKMVDNPNLLVVNVLSDYWYQDCHIAGSINVPLKELIYMVQDWDRSQEIVVYCALDACDDGEQT